ncbi:MAG: type II secretion system protein [Betaproteobacteria bacterium]
MRTGVCGGRCAGGLAYVALLVVLAILALAAAATARLGAATHRHLAEAALLEAGATFSAALDSYARSTPKGQPDAPRSLQDLLRDPRHPGTVRHLRRVPVDPLTGSQRWGLLREEDDDNGEIVGVYSLARGRPLKQANFDRRFQDFERRQTYAEWLFVRPPDPAATGLRSGLVEGGVLRMQERVPARSVAPWPSEDDKETGTGLSGTPDGR